MMIILIIMIGIAAVKEEIKMCRNLFFFKKHNTHSCRLVLSSLCSRRQAQCCVCTREQMVRLLSEYPAIYNVGEMSWCVELPPFQTRVSQDISRMPDTIQCFSRSSEIRTFDNASTRGRSKDGRKQNIVGSLR